MQFQIYNMACGGCATSFTRATRDLCQSSRPRNSHNMEYLR